jgi:hypothetical protein
VAVVVLAIAACSGLREAPPDIGRPAASSAAPAAGALAIDPTGTEVRVLVYRAGTLAALGHNHVITSAALEGRIDPLPGDEYRFDLALPVSSFTVDPEQPRAEEGPDFAAPVADEARAGTRENLLGERVLDGAAFPAIYLAGQTRPAPDGSRNLQLAVTLRGETREFVVPVTLDAAAAGGGGVLRGELRLTHADLGLTPFSVMGGMIAVRDDLLVRFRVAVVPRTG